MDLSAFRKAPLAVALMMGCAAVPAHAGWFSSDPKPAAKAQDKAVEDNTAAPAANLEDSIRQAQMLRLAAQYPEAIKHLSQLMMVASDDGRVISEYGKTLTAMGRASDGVSFLTRAQQLQPGDWTIYSAIGVAYDQIGDQKSAQAAYEHALSIKPDEPSVLSNYALSRMLAKDPEMAHKLAARAENAGGMSDAKIARNIAMIRSLAPPAAQASVASTPAAPSAPVNAASVTVNPLPQVAQTRAQTVTAHAPEAHGNRVVMQPVPVDPLAGPVHPAAKPNPVQVATKPTPENLAPVATQAPRPLQPKASQPESPQTGKPVATVAAKTEAGSPASNPVMPVPVKAVEPKPAPVTTAKAAAPAPMKAAEAKPVPVKAPAAPASTTVAKATPPAAGPAKTAEAGPSITLKMAPPAPVKAAEADKPASAPKVLPPKTVAKDAVPGLRMSANAY